MKRCKLCTGSKNCVPGNGPIDARTACIGEAPGPTEDRKLVPFEGKTGTELNGHYLPLGGLRRSDIRVDNAIHCLPPRDGKLDMKKQVDKDLLYSCAEAHLWPYLEEQRPELIIPMGAFACHAIDPSIELEMDHGFPIKTSWGTAFPMYHPAGGIHEPKKMLIIRTDWTRLRKYMLGKLFIPTDTYEGNEQYEIIESVSHLRDTLCNDYTVPMGCDTETMRGGTPFCFTYSVKAGTGYLIKADREDLLEEMQAQIKRWRGPFLFHNWTFDALPTRIMRLIFPKRRILDTMSMVFNLGNLPQGLKALSRRELGMKMQDFDDVVTPFAKPRVLQYYMEAYSEKWPKPEPQLVRDSKTQKWKVYKAHSLNTKLKTFFTYLEKDPEKDIFDAWSNWEDCHEMVENVLGKWPGKCISYVPMDLVKRYACRDADALVRLYPKLKYMEHRMRSKPQEQWSDGYEGEHYESQQLHTKKYA